MEKNGEKLLLWDIMVCGKKSVLNSHDVQLYPNMGKLTCILWTTDGGLFVLDSYGNVYTVSTELIKYL